jgi:hypothetical protein
MPVTCPNKKQKPKYRFHENRRLAFCGDKVVENVKFKKDKEGKLVKAAKQAKTLDK